MADLITRLRWERGNLTDDAADEIERLQAEVERLEGIVARHRWNVEELDDGRLMICRGEHEKGHKCEWEYYVRAGEVERLRRDSAAVEELVAADRDFDEARMALPAAGYPLVLDDPRYVNFRAAERRRDAALAAFKEPQA